MHPWQSERLCQRIVPHSVRSDQAAEPSLREPELRRFVHSIIAGGLDWASASDRDLEFLEAVDTTVRLAVRWPVRGIPGLEPGQFTDRLILTARVSEKARRDPGFRLDLLLVPLPEMTVSLGLEKSEGIASSPAAPDPAPLP